MSYRNDVIRSVLHAIIRASLDMMLARPELRTLSRGYKHTSYNGTT